MSKYLKDDSIIIHLDSRVNVRYLEKDSSGNPLSTNFSYDLVESISIPDDELVEISLYNATIPYSFYNVRSGVNNKLTIHWLAQIGQEHEEAEILLDEGNYSATGIAAQLQTKITALDPAVYPVLQAINIITVYSRETLKYIFNITQSIPNTEEIYFNFTNSNTLFGFRYTFIPYTFTGVDGALKLESDICIDINDNIHGLYIRQNLTSKSTLDNETGTFSNILARIPINTNAGGIIFHNPSNSTHRALTSLHSISTINIKLTDDANNTINLNGLHFQISLLLTFVGKKDRINIQDKAITREQIFTKNLLKLKDMTAKNKQLRKDKINKKLTPKKEKEKIKKKTKTNN